MELIEDGLVLVESTDPGAVFATAQGLINAGAKSILLVAADANQCTPEQWDPWLRAQTIPVFGGVFPQIIFGAKNFETGYVVAGLRDRCEVVHVGHLSEPSTDFSRAVELARSGLKPPKSVLVFVDGLASQIGAFLDGAYDVLGGAVSFIGGGAGSLSFQQRPCLFSNAGILQDHAVMVDVPGRFNVAVDHGWERFVGPFVVTGANGNVVSSLDYQPAFEFYRKHVEADSGSSFESSDFFSIAKGYPIGMEKPDGTVVVRDPISRNADALVCVGEVQMNSVGYLLKGDPDKLIAAASGCARKVGAGKAPALLVDCISRVLYLEGRFGEELLAVQSELGGRHLFGMLTLGEIANDGNYCLEFYNKTLVLAAGA